jgi:hypothetical protein
MTNSNLLVDLDQPIWGAEAIGAAIGRTESQAFHLLNRDLLDADKVGGRWVSTPRRLRASLRASASAAREDNAAA